MALLITWWRCKFVLSLSVSCPTAAAKPVGQSPTLGKHLFASCWGAKMLGVIFHSIACLTKFCTICTHFTYYVTTHHITLCRASVHTWTQACMMGTNMQIHTCTQHTAPAPTVGTCFRRYMFMMCSDRTPLYTQFTINLDLVLPFSHYIS